MTFKEALLLSSPVLVDEIEKYLNKDLNEKESEKLLLSICRFYLRASYRCTPFGLFAGISIGKLQDNTFISLNSRLHYKKNIRLDTHFLSDLTQKILRNTIIRNSVKWFTNNTIYPIQNKLRYIEYRVDKDSRTHHLALVVDSEYVQLVLNRAMKGATIAEIIEVLITDEITNAEATLFIEEMILCCLLVPDVEPLVTGEEYHHQLLEKLSIYCKEEKDNEFLISTVDILNRESKQSVGNSLVQIKSLIEKSKSVSPTLDSGKLFQCDMLKPTSSWVNG